MERLGPNDVAGWIRRRATDSRRYLFGLAGPPGSGKSTLAARLGAALDAPVVAMDGFHLPNTVLVDRELLDRKGAPETFDAQGFTDLLRRLRGSRRPVSCPGFDRTLDEPVADAVVVGADQRIVIVEGNYLLLDAEPWRAGHGVLDAVAYLDAPEAVRIERLIARHVEFGRSPGDAAAFVLASDMANARLVEAGRSRADLLIGSPVV